MKRYTLKLIVVFAALILTINGCKKEEAIADSAANKSLAAGQHRNDPIVTCGIPTTVNLITGNNITAGTVTVSNDQTNLYVTYATTGNWRLKNIQMYVGDCALIPMKTGGGEHDGDDDHGEHHSGDHHRNGGQNHDGDHHGDDDHHGDNDGEHHHGDDDDYNACAPAIDSFPYIIHLQGDSQHYVFTIPLSSIPSCFCIVAKADVQGQGCTAGAAWAQGDLFCNSSKAMKFSVCVQACTPVTEGCTLDPSLVPGNPDNSWLVGSVNLGGFAYSQNEANGIIATPASDIRTLFIYAANIKLSGNNVSSNATVWVDENAVDAWLATQAKISPTNLPVVPSAVMQHVNNIIVWSGAHPCS